MQKALIHWHFIKRETRLAHPGERLISADPISGYCVEEMRSLEVEREHDVGTERWERLRRRDAGSDVVPTGMRVNKGLVAEGFDEIESRCRGSRGNPWACDY